MLREKLSNPKIIKFSFFALCLQSFGVCVCCAVLVFFSSSVSHGFHHCRTLHRILSFPLFSSLLASKNMNVRTGQKSTDLDLMQFVK